MGLGLAALRCRHATPHGGEGEGRRAKSEERRAKSSNAPPTVHGDLGAAGVCLGRVGNFIIIKDDIPVPGGVVASAPSPPPGKSTKSNCNCHCQPLPPSERVLTQESTRERPLIAAPARPPAAGTPADRLLPLHGLPMPAGPRRRPRQAPPCSSSAAEYCSTELLCGVLTAQLCRPPLPAPAAPASICRSPVAAARPPPSACVAAVARPRPTARAAATATVRFPLSPFPFRCRPSLPRHRRLCPRRGAECGVSPCGRSPREAWPPSPSPSSGGPVRIICGPSPLRPVRASPLRLSPPPPPPPPPPPRALSRGC